MPRIENRRALRVVAVVATFALLLPLAAACAPPRTAPPAYTDDGGQLMAPPPAALTSPDTQLAVLRGPIPWPFEANGGQGPEDAPL